MPPKIAAEPAAGRPPPAPPILSTPAHPKSSGGQFIARLLSGFLLLVLTSAGVALLDDSGNWLLGRHFLSLLSGLLGTLALLATLFVYLLMGLTPIIPKRIFLPVVAVMALPFYAVLPVVIYHYDWLRWMDGILALCSGLVCCLSLRGLHGTWRLRWPLVRAAHLGARGFSGWNLLGFVLVNAFVVLPGSAAYLGLCAGAAMSHFTDGFVQLRPAGIVLQARKYTRADGRTVVLFPMSHIAESDFYRSVAQSVPSNAVVLMEGVSDTNQLLTTRLSYQRTAKSLHLAEQHAAFRIERGQLVRADVDVQNFSTSTIAMLNLVSQVYAEGLNQHTLTQLLRYSPTDEGQAQLLDDLLVKRNQHVLGELQARLPGAGHFIIPWGAAHMAGLAQGLEQAGFHLVSTRDFVSIRFGGKPRSNGKTDWVPWKPD